MSLIVSTSQKAFTSSKQKVKSSILLAQDNTNVVDTSLYGWTPKRINGIKLWLDAGDYSTLTMSGTGVVEWRDKSGNGTKAYQTNSSYRPTRIGYGSERKGISFNGSQWLEMDGFNGNCKTIYIVLKFATGSNAQYRGVFATRDYDSSYVFTRRSDKTIIMSHTGPGTALRGGQYFNGKAVEAKDVYVNGINSVAANFTNGEVGLTLNNGQRYVIGFTGLIDSKSTKYFTIGRDNLTYPTAHWNGDICEFIIVDDEISMMDRLMLEAYLSNKWEIAINPNNDCIKYFLNRPSFYDSLEEETKIYFNNLTRNGGTISDKSLKTVNELVKDLKTAGLYSKIIDMGIYCGNNLAAAMTKLFYHPSAGPYITNVNFVETDYNERLGLTGNGTSKYLKTGVLGTYLSLNSISLSTYCLSKPSAIVVAMGAANSSSQRVTLCQSYTDQVVYSNLCTTVGSAVNYSLAANSKAERGHLVGSRTSSAYHAFFRNGIKLGSSTDTNVGSLPTLELTFFGHNVSGTVSAFSPYTEGMYHIGYGLDDSEIIEFSRIVRAFQEKLGRTILANRTSIYDTLNAETKEYYYNIIANGGTISDKSLKIVDELVSDLKTYGLRNKIVDMGVYCGSNLAAALTKLFYPSDCSPYLTSYNFVESDFDENLGLVGDGSTKYLDTGLRADEMTLNNTSLSVYSKAVDYTYGSGIGAYKGGTANMFAMHYPHTDGKIYFDAYNGVVGAGVITSTITAQPTGFRHILGTRVSSSSASIIRNGEVLNSSTTTGGALPTGYTFYVFARNGAGTADHFSRARECFYHFGLGFTVEEAKALYKSLETLNTKLGRNGELESETSAYLANIAANSGSISTYSTWAVNELVKDLKSAGLWSKILEMGIYCGDNLNAALTKLVYHPSSGPYIENHGFTDGDYSENLGIQGDGSSKYLNTKFKVKYTTINNVSLSTYVKSNFLAGAAKHSSMSAGSSLNVRLGMFYGASEGYVYADSYIDTVGRAYGSMGAAGNGWGLLFMNRTSSSHLEVRRNLNIINTQTTVDANSASEFSSIGEMEMYTFAENTNGQPRAETYSWFRECSYHIGNSLASNEATLFYNIIQNFHSRLGRQV